MDISSVEDLKKALSAAEGTVRLEGVFDGYDGAYTYPLNLDENK